MEKKSCPYPGLRPFTEAESVYFKGRDLHIRQIIKQLEERNIVMITGASGDGKSSLVYAGIIPNARAGFFHAEYNNWCFVDFRPERSPLKNLALSLAEQLELEPEKVEYELQFGFSALVSLYKSSDYYLDKQSNEWLNANSKAQRKLKNRASNLFILADQFEEFFTNSENFENGKPSIEAYTTVNLLLETAAVARFENLPIYVVFTMRSDFISQCVAFKGLPEIIGYSQFFVPRLKRNEIQQVIEEPAMLAGGKISKRLVEILINELRDGFDQLPVMQHALNLLWQTADNGNQELDLIHLAKLAGMPTKFLNEDQEKEFEEWFYKLPEFRKKFYEKPSLNNVLNSHANLLYNTAFEYFQSNIDWAQKSLSKEEAYEVLKVVFQSLTKIDQGRAVRNRMTLNEITQIINKKNIAYETVCGILNVFRLPNSTFIRPFINQDDVATQYISGDTILDITHEALIRNWEILRKWEEEEYNNLANFEDFKIQLKRWSDNDKSTGYLLALGPLSHFETWYATCKPNMYWIAKYDAHQVSRQESLIHSQQIAEDTREFIEGSRRYIVKIEKAKRRRKNILMISSLIVALILLGFTLWALREKEFAVEQQAVAQSQKQEAVKQSNLAVAEKNRAITANKLAETEKQRAEQNAKLANEAKFQSDIARNEADKQRLLAESSKQIATKEADNALIAKKLADQQRKIAEAASDTARGLTYLATSQSLSFKSLQNYEDPQINLLLAWFSYKFNKNYGGNLRDAAVYEALRFSLANSGDGNEFLHSPTPIKSIYLTEDQKLISFSQNGILTTVSFLANSKPIKQSLKYASKLDSMPSNAAFFANGNLFVSYENLDFVRWNLKDKTPVILNGHTGFVRDIAWFESNNQLVSGSRDQTLRLWDLNNTSKDAIFSFEIGSRITSLANVDQKSKVIAGCSNGDVLIYDFSTKEKTIICKGFGRITDVAVSPNKNLSVVATSTGVLRIIKMTGNYSEITDIQTGAPSIDAIAINKNSTLLAIATADKSIRIYSLQDTELKPIKINDHKQNVTQLEFSVGDELFAVCTDNSIRKWESQLEEYAKQVEAKLKRNLTKDEWKRLIGNNIKYEDK